MTAVEVLDEIEALLLATGQHPGAGVRTATGMAEPSAARTRSTTEDRTVVRGVERLIAKYRVYGAGR